MIFIIEVTSICKKWLGMLTWKTENCDADVSLLMLLKEEKLRDTSVTRSFSFFLSSYSINDA